MLIMSYTIWQTYSIKHMLYNAIVVVFFCLKPVLGIKIKLKIKNGLTELSDRKISKTANFTTLVRFEG